ncbi:hypothetical protein L596_012363 [Steinernema carpocapsae]|uniref:Transforming acidic coiled-coil-containing protein C-terminal domain-containing protein n=1 Tax=Steinernema carpocapsae TaxID=34508 RepID=A0A4U5NX30_STECR|nr:hypothetical protein L596_012363 [Steinernema carpocapsae]
MSCEVFSEPEPADALDAMEADVFINGQVSSTSSEPAPEPSAMSTPLRSEPPVLETGTATMPRPTRQRRSTVTVKSKLAESISEIFGEAKKDNTDIDDMERRIQLEIIASEKLWSDKVTRSVEAVQQDFSKKEVGMQAVIEQLSESEKMLHGKCIELAENGSRPSLGMRPPLPMANGIGRADRMQGELTSALRERDRMAEEFGTLENNYGDLFRRYETLRVHSQTLRDNEAKLKQEAEALAIKNSKLQQKLEDAAVAAQETLLKANEEIDALNHARETDNLALRMKVKQYSTQVASLEATINAKNNELEELQMICNELLQKADIHEEDNI